MQRPQTAMPSYMQRCRSPPGPTETRLRRCSGGLTMAGRVPLTSCHAVLLPRYECLSRRWRVDLIVSLEQAFTLLSRTMRAGAAGRGNLDGSEL